MTAFTSAADQEADVATFVHPDTIVYTKNGPKPIKDIKLSDTLSSGAKLSDIMQLHFQGSLENINGQLVGPHHQLSVLQGSQESLKHGVATPKWLPAAAIAEGDYLEFTIPTASETVPLSEDDCWLLGITVGQGKQSGSEVELPHSAITDTLVKHCEDTKVPFVSAKSGAVTFQSPFNTSLIFRPDGSKSLAPELLHMSKVQLEAFTSGLEDASHGDKFQLDTTSLAAQVQFMYLGRGIMTHIDGNGQLARTADHPGDWFAFGNSLFRKVTHKEQHPYNGPVYDLQIAGGLGEDPDTQPSYMTSGGLHHNGGGKRNGSIAVYLEPWHGDVLEFVALKRNHGDEALRCRDLFLALWINDLFMKRVEADGIWSLMCPNTSPGLSDVYDKDDEHMDFTNLYERYEAEGKFQKQIRARELWDSIIVSQIETGVPYMLYKDSVNRKSNQSNLGTIKSSNLCCEIMEFSSSDETAVCLTGDTEILTETGLCRIDRMKSGAKVLAAYDDINCSRVEAFVPAELLAKGTQYVYEIKITGSKSIKATRHHKFLVQTGRNYNTKTNQYAWKKVFQLVQGDRLATPKTAPLPEFSHVNIRQALDDEHLVAGWLIGDGWQRTYEESKCYGACFGKTEIEAQQFVIPMLNKWHQDAAVVGNGRDGPVATYVNKVGTVQWASGKQGFISYIQEKFGLMPSLGKNKVIPDKMRYDATPAQQAAFLSGYFSADGSVYGNGRQYVSLSSASLQLLEGTQAMLRSFGIQSRVVFSEVESRQRYQGHLTFYGRQNLLRFRQHINFMLCQEKRDQLDAVTRSTHIGRVIEQEWHAVESVSGVGQAEVYDLILPSHHTFLAGGVITHNCNLASVALRAFVRRSEDKPAEFDFQELHKIIKVMTRNLNRVIDLNYYPVETARNSNMKHRPIGLGVQGLADAFMMMRYPFESAEAQALNKDIFETIYHAALEASCEMAAERETEVLEYKQLAAIDDKPKELKRQLTQILKKTKFTQEELTRERCCGSYDSYLWNGGCPLSKGIFQFDMWNVKPSDRWNWTTLLEQIEVHGVRNSLLVAPMPTASTSQILNNYEAFEAPTSNIFTRRTLAGEFVVANKYMLQDLIDRGLWNESIRARVIAAGGSIQDIEEIPDDLKALYKTMWEVKMRTVIDMARDRGAFVDQSQSMNLYMANPTLKNMTSMHFYAWKAGLKTGMYYARTRPKARPQQFTVDPLLVAKKDKVEALQPSVEEVSACSLENKEACQMCSG